MKFQQYKYFLILIVAVFAAACAEERASSPSVDNSDVAAPAVATTSPAEVAKREPDVPYVPTHEVVVDEMLKMAEVRGDDVLYDLGSGDGRIPITAARRFGTRGVGIDINPTRVREANENAQKANVTDKVRFAEADLFTSDFSEATVVTLYLLPEVNLKLRPQLLSQLKPGTRIVSHNYDMGDWKPEKQKTVKTPDGVDHYIYFWRVPEKRS